MTQFETHLGNCSDILKTMASDSMDAVVTDPPYGLSKSPDVSEVLRHWLAGDDYTHTGSGFMGKKWDSFVPGPSIWKEVFRVLKPGGYALVFSGTRTQDLMALSLRLAGFTIINQMQWVFSSGFPKSMDISKAIDKKFGAEREVIGVKNATYDGANRDPSKHGNPADQSVIGKWGLTETPHGAPLTAPATVEAKQWNGWGTNLKPAYEPILIAYKPLGYHQPGFSEDVPIHTHADHWDEFIYCPKASRTDRHEGLIDPGPQFKRGSTLRKIENTETKGNNHPTVKPTMLMRRLIQLVLNKNTNKSNFTVLDPFMGSGSTGKACMLEGVRFCGIEMDEHYHGIALSRISYAIRMATGGVTC